MSGMEAVHGGEIRFADLSWRGRQLRLEYQWVGVRESRHPVVVFLHEGLGSIALWRDFPAAFCRQYGLTGLVFSRYGYGWSTPRVEGERWPPSFMQQQAEQVLPQLFEQLGVRRPWLFGHSDGGSISLLYAALLPNSVSGIVVAAPHIFVEDVSITSIEAARDMYLNTDLRSKLARFHQDVDSAFWGWNAMWLDPAFRSWNIEQMLPRITCPVLAIQGEDDEYGTLDQIRGIQLAAPQTRLLVLPRCRHSPHRDQPEIVMQRAADFITGSY
jgi:pimeloyl-ACP methyl ester carboxylesterase